VPFLLQDAASAAGNAAMIIFTYNLFISMCAIHAMKIWQEKNKAKPKVMRTFNDDFEKYKNCPILDLITSRVLLEKMLEKWR
jgi:hypothetical protein